MEEYDIGSFKLMVSKGSKRPNDYILHWDNNEQFTDLMLFDKLTQNIDTKDGFFKFLKLFNECSFIEITKECVETKIPNRKDVIDYVNQVDLPDDLKLCLASMIFRCDIDNINYRCPPYNGCVRHYVQIFMIFGYKFNINAWKIKKIQCNNIANEEVYSCGHPRNQYDVGNNDFKEKYTEIFKRL